MLYLILFSILILLYFCLYNIKYIKIIYLKNLLIPSICIIFILSLIIFSDKALKGASSGIYLSINMVFPALFPFFVATEILKKTNIIKVFGILLEPIMRPFFDVPGCGAFALAMGLTSGYPVGASITSSLRNEELLTKVEAERLLTFTNNSGPLFIIGTVSVGIFKIPELGFLLLSTHILASITVGFIFKFHGMKHKIRNTSKKEKVFTKFKKEFSSMLKKPKKNLGSIIEDSIKNSIQTILTIGGFITLFSVLISVLIESGFITTISELIELPLKAVFPDTQIIEPLLCGFFEITAGINRVNLSENIAFVHKLLATCIITGWAGLSVHAQVISIVSKTDISLKPYFLGKALHGLISALYAFLFIKLINPEFLQTTLVFSSDNTYSSINWIDYFIYSFKFLGFSLLVIFFFIFVSTIINLFVFRREYK